MKRQRKEWQCRTWKVKNSPSRALLKWAESTSPPRAQCATGAWNIRTMASRGSRKRFRERAGRVAISEGSAVSSCDAMISIKEVQHARFTIAQPPGRF